MGEVNARNAKLDSRTDESIDYQLRNGISAFSNNDSNNADSLERRTLLGMKATDGRKKMCDNIDIELLLSAESCSDKFFSMKVRMKHHARKRLNKLEQLVLLSVNQK